MASAQSRLRAVAGHMRCSPAAEQSADGPLKGVLVVEWTTAVQGPAAGQYLSDMGASVIKIEGPVGDGNRHGRGTQNETVSSRLRDIAAVLFFWAVVAAVADGSSSLPVSVCTVGQNWLATISHALGSSHSLSV